MTPCEKLGYKVGDRFKAGRNGAAGFLAGTDIILAEDDGTNRPLFQHAERSSFDQFCWLSDVEPLPITLRKGDYCSTANMTEDEYHAVAAAFMAAGAEKGEYPNWCWVADDRILPRFGWLEGKLYHGGGEFTGRHLTPAQIIGAVNAKTEESNMQNNDGWIENTGTCPVDKGTRIDVRYRDGEENYGVKALEPSSCEGSNPDRSAMNWRPSESPNSITHYRLRDDSTQEQQDMHPIDNLHTKRQARDVAEQQYQAALADVREKLGDKFMLAEVSADMASGRDWTGTTQDMSDPNNWRAGDIVKYSSEGTRPWYTAGKEYQLKNQGGRLGVIDDDGEFMTQSVNAGRLTFVRRT